MSSPIITALLMDDENRDKFAFHGLSDNQVSQLLGNDNVILPNRRTDIHKATHVLIGRDNGGAPIFAPIEPTHEPDLWRPVTAWPATGWELAQLTTRGI